MRELVIVISDLYLQARTDRAPASARSSGGAAQRGALEGLEHVGRFAHAQRLAHGWRPWAAHWLGVGKHAGRPPASVAAAALGRGGTADAVWLATPLHLSAGLTGVHADRRSILRLPQEELERLAADFARVFAGAGLALRALASGEFLLSMQPSSAVITVEPARALLCGIAAALPRGAGAAALRRLGAEAEMWLHAHPLNEQRARRGAAPVSTLWLWGGGEAALTGSDAQPASAAAVFGCDSYLGGMLARLGASARPVPADARAAIGYAGAERALCVLEVGEVLHAHPTWTLGEALASLDARLLRPALEALERGELERLVLVANDRHLALRAADRWRRWRKRRFGLEALE